MKKQARYLALLFLTYLIPSSFARAEFELGVTYYQQNNFAKAYEEFLNAAQYGDHDAQQNLGAMFYRGEHVKQDAMTAYAWMALAAQDEKIKATDIHLKIFNKLNDADRRKASEIYQSLLAQYGDAAIEKRLMPVFTGKTINTKEQRVIKSVLPSFDSLSHHQMKAGFVDISYTIDKYGFTRDHVVIYTPSEAISRRFVEALRKFQYEPAITNGRAIAINGLRQRLYIKYSNQKHDEQELTKVINELREKAKTGSNSDKFGYAYFLEMIPSYTKYSQPTDNFNEWYVNAANQGSGAASYFLGRNILYGNMCQQDNQQSFGWLLKAAKAGISDAEYMLALETLSGARFEKNEDQGFYWIARAANNSRIAKVRYAWILATHPDNQRRNGKLAQSLMQQVGKDYLDKQSYYQSHAAVAAENGDFTMAVKWQKKAIDDAEDLELPVGLLEQQLASYKSKKTWREEI